MGCLKGLRKYTARTVLAIAAVNAIFIGANIFLYDYGGSSPKIRDHVHATRLLETKRDELKVPKYKTIDLELAGGEFEGSVRKLGDNHYHVRLEGEARTEFCLEHELLHIRFGHPDIGKRIAEEGGFLEDCLFLASKFYLFEPQVQIYQKYLKSKN